MNTTANTLVLDFEKNIFEIESKIESLKYLAQSEDVDISQEVSRLQQKLEKQVKRTADVSNAVTPEKEQAAEKLSRLLGHRVEVVPAAEADNFVKDKTAAAPLLKPFTPDHIVYCGPYPLFVENIDEAKSALDAFMAENDKEPRLILVQGVGAFIMEDDKGKAAKAQLLVKDAIKLAVYAESFGGPLQMTDEITYFITHWEAEAYRSKK